MTRLIKLTRSTECEDCGRILPPGSYIYKYKINDFYCHKCLNKRGNPPETFGDRIRLLRLANRFSREQCAEKCSISESILSYYENHKTIPHGTTLIFIAKVFDTTSDYLLCLSDDPNRREDDEQ